MGLGYHGLQFLRFAAKHARFGRVATIGRQEVCLNKKEVCSLIGVGAEYKHEKYCHGLLLQHFGATCVDSWDYSDYEGASQIADMNKPLDGRPSTYVQKRLRNVGIVPRRRTDITYVAGEQLLWSWVLAVFPGTILFTVLRVQRLLGDESLSGK